jgi:Uncharacterised protein family UPF0547
MEGKADTKTCPECAEEVKAAAHVCRFCGYRFDGATGAPSPRSESILAGKRWPKVLAVTAAGVVLVTLVLLLLKPWAPEPFKATPQAKPQRNWTPGARD